MISLISRTWLKLFVTTKSMHGRPRTYKLQKGPDGSVELSDFEEAVYVKPTAEASDKLEGPLKEEHRKLTIISNEKFFSHHLGVNEVASAIAGSEIYGPAVIYLTKVDATTGKIEYPDLSTISVVKMYNGLKKK